MTRYGWTDYNIKSSCLLKFHVILCCIDSQRPSMKLHVMRCCCLRKCDYLKLSPHRTDLLSTLYFIKSGGSTKTFCSSVIDHCSRSSIPERIKAAVPQVCRKLSCVPSFTSNDYAAVATPLFAAV